jgi:hypothetical protein
MNYNIQHFKGYCELLHHGEAPETARRIDDGQDCSCKLKKKYSIQCHHEYKCNGCQFVALRFSVRYIKLILVLVPLVQAAAGPINKADHQIDDGNDNSADLGQSDLDRMSFQLENDDEDSDDEVTLAQLVPKKNP